MLHFLGQTRSESSIFVWSLVLMALVVGGFVLVSWVRRQVKEPEQSAGTGFTLADLREMKRKGQISEDEFEKARTQMVAAMKAAAERKKAAEEGTGDDRLLGA